MSHNNGNVGQDQFRDHHGMISAAVGLALRWDLVRREMCAKSLDRRASPIGATKSPSPNDVEKIITLADQRDPRLGHVDLPHSADRNATGRAVWTALVRCGLARARACWCLGRSSQYRQPPSRRCAAGWITACSYWPLPTHSGQPAFSQTNDYESVFWPGRFANTRSTHQIIIHIKNNLSKLLAGVRF